MSTQSPACQARVVAGETTTKGCGEETGLQRRESKGCRAITTMHRIEKNST